MYSNKRFACRSIRRLTLQQLLCPDGGGKSAVRVWSALEWLLDPDAAQRCKKQVRTREDLEDKGTVHRIGQDRATEGPQWTAPA
ncbi:hypothetical protein CSOJ01_14005 [Colletotrichum sojae]|uniref:Uncharacterized protein n=1 Tax=Colletotrichum sojae TaxID=2175907 RepID=A0A8H6MJL5_9PEZI|nr:hypothetical protein CSOJ01_14005 [Colletotrichum sojae]